MKFTRLYKMTSNNSYTEYVFSDAVGYHMTKVTHTIMNASEGWMIVNTTPIHISFKNAEDGNAYFKKLLRSGCERDSLELKQMYQEWRGRCYARIILSKGDERYTFTRDTDGKWTHEWYRNLHPHGEGMYSRHSKQYTFSEIKKLRQLGFVQLRLV